MATTMDSRDIKYSHHCTKRHRTARPVLGNASHHINSLAALALHTVFPLGDDGAYGGGIFFNVKFKNLTLNVQDKTSEKGHSLCLYEKFATLLFFSTFCQEPVQTVTDQQQAAADWHLGSPVSYSKGIL